ncbi:LptF/LptG family permease [Botrimarina mediterranea]|uniref:Putative permease YjgP/YjgQ family protein n=1 Tax=Botrimarina mediterranea TaxID=2528022 RepID=A0A518KB67_9BACT|nr:LptF/LptG family permease [Botrimarina mediterranea]QDV75030.1 putative permease YjgP/YjgQ family protein [Botrimarina mediterranea]QDV79676.1 putative permease YjgP/YjgQ family protein [Planctomycetes bacterium K2D]
MKLLTRYVLLELLQVFLLTLAGLTALIFVGLIGKEAVDKGLGLGPLLRMTPYMLPQAMQFAVPATMLLATTSVYGRLSATNEIIAIKAMGISPWKLALPTMILAAATSLGAVALNDIAVSWGRLGVQRVFVESLEEVIYSQLRLHRSYAEGGLQISVQHVVDRTLVRPTVIVQAQGDNEAWKLESDSAQLSSSPDRKKLIVRFEGIALEGEVKAVIDSTVEREIDLEELFGESSSSRSPSNYALSEIDQEQRIISNRIADIHRRETTEQALAMMTGDFDRLSAESWFPLTNTIAGEEYRYRRLSVEPFRRWANGFSCLAFVMVGVPMAIWRQKGEFLASFFLCFLPILLVYYPLLMVSVDHAKQGDVPPIAVWVGNAVLALWGLWMMRRVVRN